MLQLKKFPDIPVSTREEARESRPHPEEPRFSLLAREEGSFPFVVGKEFQAFPSHLKRRCSPLTTGTSGTRSGGLRKGQSPCELLGGLSGLLFHRCRGLRPCVKTVPEPEDSSPVLTWILGYFRSLPRGVRPHLVWGHAPALSPELQLQCRASLRVDQGILWMWAELSCFLWSGDGCVGELLELQQGCEGPFEFPDVSCD